MADEKRPARAAPTREEVVDRIEGTLDNVKQVQEDLMNLLRDLNEEEPLR